MTDVKPDLQTWLALPTSEIAAQVSPHHLSLSLGLDGTRRHYLLHHPTESGNVSDLMDYGLFAMNAFARVCNMLFSLGLETVLLLNLWAPDIERREPSFLQFTIEMSEKLATSPQFQEMYQRWQIKARLYGDYDVSPKAAPIREGLYALDERLTALTPEGERRMLFGFYVGSVAEEMIERTLRLREQLGRPPTGDELKHMCFPHGPDQLDIFIGSGWLRSFNLHIPPVLNNGVDVYSLAHLPLDLEEYTVRRILYDLLFLRRVTSLNDNISYTPPIIESLSKYYAEHHRCLVGLGHLVGPDLWHPDHDHGSFLT